MSRYSDLPFVQAGGHGGNRSQTQCLVIHATDNTAAATNEANYAKTRDDGVSAHFYSDEGTVIQALDTAVVAYGCFPTGNSRSVQFELVGRSNALSDATLRRIAPTVARACAEWGIPIRHVSPTDLRGGAKGICGHGDVTRAWGEGDHTDPGDSFPWDRFIGYVQAAAGGGTMSDYTPYGKPAAVGPRGDSVMLADLWGQEQSGVSPYDGKNPSGRSAQLKRIEDTVAGIKTDLAKRPTPVLDAAAIAALAEALKPALAALVADAVGDEIARRMEN